MAVFYKKCKQIQWNAITKKMDQNKQKIKNRPPSPADIGIIDKKVWTLKKKVMPKNTGCTIYCFISISVTQALEGCLGNFVFFFTWTY